MEQDDPTRVRPGSASQCVIRLVGALLVEINDEMIAAERRYIAAASVAELTDHNVELAGVDPRSWTRVSVSHAHGRRSARLRAGLRSGAMRFGRGVRLHLDD